MGLYKLQYKSQFLYLVSQYTDFASIYASQYMVSLANTGSVERIWGAVVFSSPHRHCARRLLRKAETEIEASWFETRALALLNMKG
jgi:hypothetical protein